MKYVDSMRRAARSLKSAKIRTLLTSLAIAVGAFTLTLSIAAGEGARQYADKIISSNIDPQSLFLTKDGSLFGEGGPPDAGGLREYSEDSSTFQGATFESLTAKDIKTIEGIDGVASVVPMYMVQAKHIAFESVEQKYIADVTAYDSSIRSEVAAGELPELRGALGENDAVVPESFLQQIEMSPQDAIGKKVTLTLERINSSPTEAEIQEAFMRGGEAAVQQLLSPEAKEAEFTITGVTAASATSLAASSALFISNGSAKDLSEWLTEGTDNYQKYIAATAQVDSSATPEEVKERIEDAGFVARTAEDLQDLLFTIVNVLQGIVFGFGILALIASAFGIINTQYISVLERTRDIGLMKALGMRGRHVSRLFQLEAAWIGLLGGIIGALLAVVLGVAMNPWISETLGLGDSSLLIFLPIPIIGLVIGLMLLAMIAGWFPARKAAKLDPIEALRTE